MLFRCGKINKTVLDSHESTPEDTDILPQKLPLEDKDTESFISAERAGSETISLVFIIRYTGSDEFVPPSCVSQVKISTGVLAHPFMFARYWL